MSTKPVKKIDPVYLLAAILLPIVVIAVGFWIGYTFFREGGTGAVVCFMGPPLVSVVWWIVGPSAIWKQKKKAMEKRLAAEGFGQTHTFYGKGCTVVADIRQGKLALLFFWNPMELYVLPASRVGKTWTDDGAAGAGFMKGTSRVSFLFMVDSVKIRVDTFISNQRWKMNDPKVLEGVSKADMWAQVLEAAKAAAGA